MLRGISIRHFRLIDRLDIEFGCGLNVITGETGAGKTILLDSLEFVLGRGRAADAVSGEKKVAEVVVEFELSTHHPATGILREKDLPSGGELILRRIAYPSGRSVAFANDRRCSLRILEVLRNALVNLHGQNDDRTLLDPGQHRRLLDLYGKHDCLLGTVQLSWKDLANSRQALASALEFQAEAATELEYVRQALKELTDLGPKPEEATALDERRRFIRQAAGNLERVNTAHQQIGMSGAIGQCSEAVTQLERIGSPQHKDISEALGSLERALIELDEALQNLENFQTTLDIDPYELENVEERLFTIRSLARKHRALPDSIHELIQPLANRLEKLDASGEDVRIAEEECQRRLSIFKEKAEELTALRIRTASRLDAEIAGELAQLKLRRATVQTEVAPSSPGGHGQDKVTFLGTTNPGQPLAPISSFASGGELARFLLAFKVCLATSNAFPCMVFDEIDKGIGGATAAAVGQRLRALARNTQVIVVTHSPQVGAMGQYHLVARKRTSNETTSIEVRPLREDQRVNEIARMLSGEQVSDEARQAAAVLLSTPIPDPG